MSTSMAQRRKAPLSSSNAGGTHLDNSSNNTSVVAAIDRGVPASSSSSQHFGPSLQLNNNNDAHNNGSGSSVSKAPMAVVRRRKFGTGAFDENWLNVDCCGLFCACMTYCLHFYAIYAVNWILIPPWMSYYDAIAADATTGTIAAQQAMNGSTGGGADAATTQEFQQRLHHQQQEFDLAAQQQQRQQQEILGVGVGEAEVVPHVRHLTWIGWLHCALFLAIAVLAIISHFKAMTTDPGAVPPDAKPIQDIGSDSNDPENNHSNNNRRQKGLRLCRRCSAFKPSRAHHCSICKRCIIKMDHHCPWVNNCVGIGNHKYFLLFVFYTFISCCYSMTLVIWRFWQCIHVHSGALHHYSHHNHHSRNTAEMSNYHYDSHHHGNNGGFHSSNGAEGGCLDQPSHLLNLLGLLVEGLLFGMFTSCMMLDQSSVVQTRMTHIDRIKKSRSEMQAKRNNNATTTAGAGTSSSSSTARDILMGTESSSSSSSFPIITGFGEVFGITTHQQPPPPPSRNNFDYCVKYCCYQIYNACSRLHFLSPFARVMFPSSVRDEIMGFCRPNKNNVSCTTCTTTLTNTAAAATKTTTAAKGTITNNSSQTHT